jgi:hypothetical protein
MPVQSMNRSPSSAPCCLRLQRGDIAVVVRVDATTWSGTYCTPSFPAVLAQEHAELAGVEVVAVVGHRRELGRLHLLGRAALHAQVRLEADQVGKRHVGMLRLPLLGRFTSP